MALHRHSSRPRLRRGAGFVNVYPQHSAWDEPGPANLQFYDTCPQDRQDPSDILHGLRHNPKRISCKYLYDQRGSHLFKEITRLDEYYLTRTEMWILRRYANEILAHIGHCPILIDLGSVDGEKADVLLSSAASDTVYVPVDISKEALLQGATTVARTYPHIKVKAVCADYTQVLPIPRARQDARPVVLLYAGSSIGNFDPPDAVQLLRHFASRLRKGDGILIGVDMKKDPERLWKAYNDTQGVTAAFNLNLLERMNHTWGANFNLQQFEHLALYNEEAGRIEMYLKSKVQQTVHIAGIRVEFAAGELIHTENSYKYTIEEFRCLAAHAGWEPTQVWTDQANLFSVHYLRIP